MTSSQSPTPISVIIPVFGVKFAEPIRAVLAMWRHQTVCPSMVLAEAVYDGEVLFEDIANEFGARHCVVPMPGGEPFRVSLVRNVGASQANAEALYFSDADVIAVDPSFLETMVEFSEGNPVIRAPMAHLRQTSVEPLVTWAQAAQAAPGQIFNPVCDFIGEQIVPTTVPVETRVHLNEEWVTYDEAVGVVADGVELASLVHWGGLLCTSSQFEEVGGYCEAYESCGCEDDDLAWKLSTRHLTYHAKTAYHSSYPLLHLDHVKGHGDDEVEQLNYRIQRNRRKAPIETVIRGDRRAFWRHGSETDKDPNESTDAPELM